MTHGYQALTEKEKQTLRLIVRGHDTKSMARHLGLSVHTVNERLRDARRKLEVSSSREAARLVFDAEGAAPEKLADTQMGVQPGPRPARPVRSRVLLSQASEPAPPAGVEMVKFRTDFANKAGAIETVSLAREHGVWKVVGIYLD